MSSTWGIRIASLQKLIESLHSFLDQHGYVHEYEPLEAELERGGLALFKSELVGKRDSPRRDPAYVVLGLLLLPTILLTSLGVRFLKESRYYLRTIARITIEVEAHPIKGRGKVPVQSGVLDGASDARVTLDMTAGAAHGDYEIVRPTEDKRELVRLAEEQQELKRHLSELLSTMIGVGKTSDTSERDEREIC